MSFDNSVIRMRISYFLGSTSPTADPVIVKTTFREGSGLLSECGDVERQGCDRVAAGGPGPSLRQTLEITIDWNWNGCAKWHYFLAIKSINFQWRKYYFQWLTKVIYMFGGNCSVLFNYVWCRPKYIRRGSRKKRYFLIVARPLRPLAPPPLGLVAGP